MNLDIFRPGYRVVIDTPAKARLYNRILKAKIAVQLLLLGGLLMLGGWTWKQLAIVLAVATVWQLTSMWLRKRKQNIV